MANEKITLNGVSKEDLELTGSLSETGLSKAQVSANIVKMNNITVHPESLNTIVGTPIDDLLRQAKAGKKTVKAINIGDSTHDSNY